jgi:hypothetical protein
MPKRYEELMKAKAEQFAQDQRAQPWAASVDISAPAPAEEWIQVDNSADSDSESGSELETKFDIFHKSTIDVRTNAFP